MGRKIGVELVKVKDRKDLETNIDNVFTQFKDTLLNDIRLDIAEKLLFWLNEWSADYLKNENTFNYLDLLRYHRGCVVEADFGFKIGSEQGGLHYALVLDSNNNKSNKVLLVVPLESLSDDKTPSDIDERYEVFLGYGIFEEDILKMKREIKTLESKISDREGKGLEVSKLIKTLAKTEKELSKLQKGSVAQLSQVCAMSKMRIHNPKKIGDKFSTFRLNSEKMSEIERKFANLYLSEKYKNIE